MSDGDVIMKEVELADVEKKRLPRRIIHFTQMSWITYLQFWLLRVTTTAFFTCDYLGGKLANLFGLNSPKYQYAIDEYTRAQEQDSDDEDEGAYIEEMGEKNVQSETDHLQMQSMEYGTIQSQETALDAEDKYHVDSETQQSNVPPSEK
ncbi:protein FAM177B-like isoform X4 [Pyxicephalus adspersus]|uniref:protein FAM177B-like isoform X4 n=1 Tax=Pyxicephalus adspersus TaxID=30357 RepID=UPI003B58F165